MFIVYCNPTGRYGAFLEGKRLQPLTHPMSSTCFLSVEKPQPPRPVSEQDPTGHFSDRSPPFHVQCLRFVCRKTLKMNSFNLRSQKMQKGKHSSKMK